jgi:hypothetical protein
MTTKLSNTASESEATLLDIYNNNITHTHHHQITQPNLTPRPASGRRRCLPLAGRAFINARTTQGVISNGIY